MNKGIVTFALAAILITASASATSIDDKYAALGGSAGFLGAASGAEKTSADGAGKFRHYANGSIYFHPATAAHEVHGLIRQKFLALGAETGTLGYPASDEIDLADGSGKVSKFQLGEVIWRSATNAVEVVRSVDLIVDPPFRAGEAWHIVQANADATGGSHGGPWVYCWDYVLAIPANTTSEGRPFVAAAGARLVFTQQDLNGPNNAGNVVIQRFGEGRYGSYLHIQQGSYTKTFAAGGILPQSLKWEQRPAPGSGRLLGLVGNTGTGGSHMHFCVTTTPDRPQFAPFESVPVAFRNYSFSTDGGATWTFVPVGVPKDEQWIRREQPKAGQLSAAQINTNATTISHGTVKGQVALTAGQGKPSGAGTITVRLETEWGELLGTSIIDTATAPNGPWPFQFSKVAAFSGHKVTATYAGTWSPATTNIGATSPAFDLAPNATATQTLSLKKLP
ncbi:MAG: hypothetical protein QOH21_1718 [Acidobacteriota bacterium]|jgi:hypothetical protein|nr:hypothetical protein [Acidobacteriota bacterium]